MHSGVAVLFIGGRDLGRLVRFFGMLIALNHVEGRALLRAG